MVVAPVILLMGIDSQTDWLGNLLLFKSESLAKEYRTWRGMDLYSFSCGNW